VDDSVLVPPLRRLWTEPLGQSISYPIVAGGFVYVALGETDDAPAHVLALDDLTGIPAWNADLAGATGGLLTYEGGRLFEADSDNLSAPASWLRAFNASTGALEWQTQAEAARPFHVSAPAAYNGTLYTIAIGSSNTPLMYAYDESSGALLWTRASALGIPAISADGVFAFDGCANSSAWDLQGNALWQKGTGACYPMGSAVVYDHTLYQLLSRSSNVRLDARSGIALGTFPSDQFAPTFGNGLELDAVDNTLQAGPVGGSVPTWSFTPEGDLVTPALTVGSSVYVASSIGTIYALDAATGKPVWSNNIDTGFPSAGFYLAGGHGLLVVPGSSELIAYGPAGASFTPDIHQYSGPKACPWTLQHGPPGPVADTPYTLVVADFNKDGKRDIALGSVGSVGGGGVNIALGVGDGSFNQLQGTWAFGDGTSLIATADVDGDGVLDIASASNAAGSDGNPNLMVMIGKGDGTFKSPTNFSTGGGPMGLALVDLNGDTRPDIVLANQGAVVLLNQGKGKFGAPTTYGSDWMSSLAVGDLNADGNPDLILGSNSTDSSQPSTVEVFLGKGAGTFGAPLRTSVAGWPQAFALGDIDGNGTLDIVVAAGDAEILSGKGDGTFAPARTFAAGGNASGVALGDVDLDGIADLVVTTHYPDSLRVLFGKADGAFQGMEVFATGAIPILPTIADFNGDGRPDIAICNTLGNSVSILLGACASAAP
jgi:outer membrane protein assembly factor BamB